MHEQEIFRSAPGRGARESRNNRNTRAHMLRVDVQDSFKRHSCNGAVEKPNVFESVDTGAECVAGTETSSHWISVVHPRPVVAEASWRSSAQTKFSSTELVII